MNKISFTRRKINAPVSPKEKSTYHEFHEQESALNKLHKQKLARDKFH